MKSLNASDLYCPSQLKLSHWPYPSGRRLPNIVVDVNEVSVIDGQDILQGHMVLDYCWGTIHSVSLWMLRSWANQWKGGWKQTSCAISLHVWLGWRQARHGTQHCGSHTCQTQKILSYAGYNNGKVYAPIASCLMISRVSCQISQGPKCTSQIWKCAVIGLRFFLLG